MRLANLIVLVWRYRQDLQKQYENALSQTVQDFDALSRLADRPPKVRKDGTLDYSLDGVDLGYLKKDDDGNLILKPGGAADPLVRDDDGKPLIRRGGMPPGGRRHNGILAFEWLAERLKKQGIDIGLEDSEYASLDEGYCEAVATLSAELFVGGHDLADNIAADRPWLQALERLPNNEAIAAQLLDELGRQFGFAQTEQAEQPCLELAAADPIVPAMMPRSQETVEVKR